MVKSLPAGGLVRSLGQDGSRKWQPSPVFLPGEARELRSLAGYSPWGYKELSTIEQLHFLLFL